MSAVARAALMLICCAALASADEEAIDWQNAADCIGRVCALRGTVAVAENDGPTIRLYFDAQRRDVRVLLMRGWLVTWPNYEGTTIVANGRVRRFRDHIEMIVVNPNDITLLSPLPTSTPPPPGPTPTPGELERLRERVRELEQQLQERGNPRPEPQGGAPAPPQG